MGIYGSYQGDLISSVSVVGATGAIFGDALRVASTSHVGPGIYSVMLEDEVSFDHSTVSVTCQTNIFSVATFTRNSLTEIIVRTWDAAGLALDSGFNLQVFRTKS